MSRRRYSRSNRRTLRFWFSYIPMVQNMPGEAEENLSPHLTDAIQYQPLYPV